MKSGPYRNARYVLPEHVLQLVQEYVDGVEIYIPRKDENRCSWGERSGTREDLRRRNRDIQERYRRGVSIEELMEEYHLGYDSIRKIIYSRL